MQRKALLPHLVLKIIAWCNIGYHLQILHIFMQKIFKFNLISFSFSPFLSDSLFFEAVQIKIPFCHLLSVAGSMAKYVLGIKTLDDFYPLILFLQRPLNFFEIVVPVFE